MDGSFAARNVNAPSRAVVGAPVIGHFNRPLQPAAASVAGDKDISKPVFQVISSAFLKKNDKLNFIGEFWQGQHYSGPIARISMLDW